MLAVLNESEQELVASLVKLHSCRGQSSYFVDEGVSLKVWAEQFSLILQDLKTLTSLYQKTKPCGKAILQKIWTNWEW